MAISHPNCYHLGMHPEGRGQSNVRVRIAPSADSHRQRRNEDERRDDEQWAGLLRWLKDEHGMDVGPSGLLVERREAQGTLHVCSISHFTELYAQVLEKVSLPLIHVR